MWVLARFRLLEDMALLRPEDETVVFRLAIEQPANTGIVTGAPEEEDDSEYGYAGAFGQYEEGQDQGSKHGEDCYIGQVLGLRGREQLRDHVVSLWNDED